METNKGKILPGGFYTEHALMVPSSTSISKY